MLLRDKKYNTSSKKTVQSVQWKAMEIKYQKR